MYLCIFAAESAKPNRLVDATAAPLHRLDIILCELDKVALPSSGF